MAASSLSLISIITLAKVEVINIALWDSVKLGRFMVNWSKPYLREFANLLELVFHYCAMRLRLESPWRFLFVYLKYFFCQNSARNRIKVNVINRFLTSTDNLTESSMEVLRLETQCVVRLPLASLNFSF